MLYKSAEIFVTCGASFYLWVWSAQPPIQSLYPWVRCIYMQECSVHLLICLLFLWVQWISTCKNVFFILADITSILMFDVFTWKNVLYTCFICLLLPWVQCQSLKPVLSQCSQTGFVTVDDFIALYTPSCVIYSHGCNVRAWNMFWASVDQPVLWQLMILLPCALTHTPSIPMGAINFYMQEHFLRSLIQSHQFLPC